jgi:hypothetical protein
VIAVMGIRSAPQMRVRLKETLINPVMPVIASEAWQSRKA